MPTSIHFPNPEDDVPESMLSSIRGELNTDDDESVLGKIHQPTILRHDSSKSEQRSDSASSKHPFEGNPVSLLKTISRTATVNDDNRDLVVPRNKRNGILSQLLLIQQYKDARRYPAPIKRLLVFVVAAVSVAGPMGTSIIFPCIQSLEKDFNTTGSKVNISIGVYLLGLGIFPIWWSSISEFNGRRTVYIISFTGLVGFSIGCSLCKNIEAFIVLRVLCGAASSSAQTMGAGVLADLFIPEERGAQIGLFYLGSLMAPLLSPIIGSLLVNRWSWRSSQWFMVIFAAVNLMSLILFLPETLRTINKKAVIKNIIKETKTEDAINASESKAISACSTEKGTDIEQGHENDDEDLEEEELVERILTTNATIATAADDAVSFQGDIEDENEEPGLLLDPIMPQLSKIVTTKSKLTRQNTLAKPKTKHEKEQIQALKDEIKQNLDHRKSTGRFKDKDYKLLFYNYSIRPMKSLYYLQYPPVALAITFSAISFAILYFVNVSLEHEYSGAPYNFKTLYIGFLYIPNSITYIIASIYGGKWVDRLLIKYKEKHGILAPEARISYNLVVAVILFPISLLTFGWCLDKKTFWVFPLIGTAMFGFASMMVIGATVSYLVDSVGSVGVAMNNLIRMVLAAIACFVTDEMLEGMGVGWAFTMLAFIVLAASSTLLILKWKSNYWRETFDLEALQRKVNS